MPLSRARDSQTFSSARVKRFCCTHLLSSFAPVCTLVVAQVEAAGREACFEGERHVGAGERDGRVGDAGANYRRVDEPLVLQVSSLAQLIRSAGRQRETSTLKHNIVKMHGYITMLSNISSNDVLLHPAVGTWFWAVSWRR